MRRAMHSILCRLGWHRWAPAFLIIFLNPPVQRLTCRPVFAITCEGERVRLNPRDGWCCLWCLKTAQRRGG